MGWFGHGIYDGDGTLTTQYGVLKTAKIKEDPYVDDLSVDLTDEDKQKLKDNINQVIKKHVSKKWIDASKDSYSNDDKAINAQMLLALFVDNKMEVPKIIWERGVEGSIYLKGEHAADFNSPKERRENLNDFIKQAKKLSIIAPAKDGTYEYKAPKAKKLKM